MDHGAGSASGGLRSPPSRVRTLSGLGAQPWRYSHTGGRPLGLDTNPPPKPTVGQMPPCGGMPHSAQPQHANYWAPRTRKRHQQEHRPQRPTESSDPTQHAKGRTGDRPGPRKGATTRRNVTQGGRGVPRKVQVREPGPPGEAVAGGWLQIRRGYLTPAVSGVPSEGECKAGAFAFASPFSK